MMVRFGYDRRGGSETEATFPSKAVVIDDDGMMITRSIHPKCREGFNSRTCRVELSSKLGRKIGRETT